MLGEFGCNKHYLYTVNMLYASLRSICKNQNINFHQILLTFISRIPVFPINIYSNTSFLVKECSVRLRYSVGSVPDPFLQSQVFSAGLYVIIFEVYI
jgi:hypothetical protein